MTAFDSNQLLRRLPDYYQERVHVVRGGSYQRPRFVLYWMRFAQRTKENPALDISISIANRLGISAFVYQQVLQDEPYANDRHHYAVLQHCPNIDKTFAELGIGYALHVERPDQHGPFLQQLANMATIVITDDMPTFTARKQLTELVNTSDVPIWSVDTACIVPMSLSQQNYTSVKDFQETTEAWRQSRIHRSWLPITPEQPLFKPALPFSPINFTKLNILALIEQCQIDHSVPIVHAFESPAKRWKTFLQHTIFHYHINRNTSASHQGSGLSAALHYGHISPFLVAREASRLKGLGPQRFLTSILLWRELSYHWCKRNLYHQQNLSHWIPDWAYKSLTNKTTPYATDLLYRAISPLDPWNTCHTSLLHNGVLSHSQRIFWGKLLLQWTKDPEHALQLLIQFNSQLALDGQNPCSYVSLLWCLGLFDQPVKQPPKIGKLRLAERPKRTTTPSQPTSKQPTIAVIGYDLSAMIAVQMLRDYGLQPYFYQQQPLNNISQPSWLSSRPFSLSDRRFHRQLQQWLELGLVTPWKGKLAKFHHDTRKELTEPYYRVHQSSLQAYLLQNVYHQFNRSIQRIRRSTNTWFFYDQAEQLMGSAEQLLTCNSLAAELFPPTMQPTVTLQPRKQYVVRFQPESPLNLPWTSIQFDHPIITQAYQEPLHQSVRNPPWVLYCHWQWSEKNPQKLHSATTIAQTFLQLVQCSRIEIKTSDLYQLTHFYTRSATPSNQHLSAHFFMPQQLHLENAYVTGTQIAGRVINELRCR